MENASTGAPGEPLRGHHLVGVPRPDVLDDPGDVGLELLAAHVRNKTRRLLRTGGVGGGPGPCGGARSAARLLDQARGALVRRLDLVGAVNARVGEHRHLVLEVVEGDHQLADHQREVGDPERVRVGRAQALDGAHEVVAEVADRPARERRRRSASATRYSPAAPRPPHRGRRPRCRPVPGPRARSASLRPAQLDPGAKAEERVAAEPPALLGGLEQEARAAECSAA